MLDWLPRWLHPRPPSQLPNDPPYDRSPIPLTTTAPSSVLSAAQQLLLSKFLRPTDLAWYAEPYTARHPDWERVLGEPPLRTIAHFEQIQLLTTVPLSGVLEFHYSVAQLKTFLRERALPVSGRKALLIERLLSADPEGIQRMVAQVQIRQCTAQGRDIAEHYLAQERQARARLEQQVEAALKAGRFEAACVVSAAFQAAQVFPVGMGMNWHEYDSEFDVRHLQWIFTATPKILAAIPAPRMKALRHAAGMMYLLGMDSDAARWLPEDLQTTLHMDHSTAARMLWFHARFLDTLATYQRHQDSVRGVQILGAPNSCSQCQAISQGHTYTLQSIPELPYAHCTSEIGCRCLMQPIWAVAGV